MVNSASWRLLVVPLLLLAAVAAGCRPPAVTFPERFAARTLQATPTMAVPAGAAYDTNGDGKPDFFFLPNPAGRYDRIAYDRDGDGEPDEFIALDALPPSQCRHLVLVLDGMPYDVVKEFYDCGGLRVLTPPAVVIAPYPAMTDLALEDVFNYVPCAAFEDLYYSRRENKVVGGAGSYLAGKNEPFEKLIEYRASRLLDGPAYLWPRTFFDKELNDVKRLWDRRDRQEVVAYLVATACMGSRQGKEGQLATLRACERLINQVIFESRGLVKVTLLADHGQTNVPCKPAGLEDYLKTKGWRRVERLEGDKDFILIQFGLVTYASLSARRPAALADDLMDCPAVELTSFVQDGAVVVRGRDASSASIRSADGGTFEYLPTKGDPLKLADLAGANTDGRELLKTTVARHHEYPDALYRLWRAHFGLVENPPDVIVSLDDRYYNGAGGFGGLVDMASTHGGLNWRNSATFIMSSAGAIPGPLRSQDVPEAMRRLFDRNCPAGR